MLTTRPTRWIFPENTENKVNVSPKNWTLHKKQWLWISKTVTIINRKYTYADFLRILLVVTRFFTFSYISPISLALLKTTGVNLHGKYRCRNWCGTKSKIGIKDHEKDKILKVKVTFSGVNCKKKSWKVSIMLHFITKSYYFLCKYQFLKNK